MADTTASTNLAAIQAGALSSTQSIQPQDQTLSDSTAYSGDLGPQTTTAAPTPDTQTTQHPGFLQRMKGSFQNPLTALETNPTDTVDDTGKLIEGATSASPGNLFKNLLVGALSGISRASQGTNKGFGAALGAGFEGGTQEMQQQQDTARNLAIQKAQLKQAATAASDKHNTAVQEQQASSVQLAAANFSLYKDSVDLSMKAQEAQDKWIEGQTKNRDSAVKDGGTVRASSKSWSEIQDMWKNDPSLAHTAQAFVSGERQVTDADGNAVMTQQTDGFHRPLKDADGKPIMGPKLEYTYDLVTPPKDHVVSAAEAASMKKAGVAGFTDGTVRPGQTIPWSSWNQAKSELNTDEDRKLQRSVYQADIAAKQSTAAAEGVRAKELSLQYENDKNAQGDGENYAKALIAANGDITKVYGTMVNAVGADGRPDTAMRSSATRLLAAQEKADAESTVQDTTQTGINSEKVTSHKGHLFDLTPPPPTVDTVAQGMLKNGSSAAEVEDLLKQKYGKQSDTIIQGLRQRKVLPTPPATPGILDKAKGFISGYTK
jgi:hypothetical protein